MNGLMPFAAGDIFVTAADLDETARFPTGKGKIIQFAADWSQKAVLETGHHGLIASLTLDRDGNLHALDPQAMARTTIGRDGKARDMFGNLARRAYGSMIALDDGDYLFGEHMVGEIPGFSGSGKVYRVNAAGDTKAQYDTETNGGMGGFLGVTHMALSADGNTLYHTSETGMHVYGHDLAGNKRLGPVYTRADPPPMVFGIARLNDGNLLVAGGNGVRQIDTKGQLVRSYAMPEGRGWAVVVLREGGESFWALDFFGGNIASIEVASGAILQTKSLGLAKCLAGIAEISTH